VGDVQRDLLASHMRHEVPLVEQFPAARLRLGEYRVVRNGGALYAPLRRLLYRTPSRPSTSWI